MLLTLHGSVVHTPVFTLLSFTLRVVGIISSYRPSFTLSVVSYVFKQFGVIPIFSAALTPLSCFFMLLRFVWDHEVRL
jgi:hypothetical protein